MPRSDAAMTGTKGPPREPGPLRIAARILIVFVAIVAICAHGIQPPGWSGRVAVWLLGSGVALAAVIRWGPVQYVPVYAANVLVDLLNGRSLAPAMIAELGLPAGVFTVVWLLRRYDFDDTFEHGRDIPLFAAAALIGMLIPAAVGAGTFAAWYPIDPMYHSAWTLIDGLRWWLNDFMGALILGPLLVAARWKALQPLRAQPIAASLLLVLLLTLVAVMLFAPGMVPAYRFLRAPALLACTILVAATCLRFGLVPAAAAGLVLTATAVCGMAFDVGILSRMDQIDGLVMLWSYIGATTVPVLLIAWLLAEQRRLERRYEQLFDACPQPLWVHDRETLRFLAVNSAAERQYGYARGELLRSTISVLAMPHEELTLATMLTANVVQPLELRQRTRDGTTVFVEVWAQSVEYGGCAAWLVFAFDVSERKALESALVTAISGEQRRLGQDLHDGLAQDLTVASILTSELAARFEEHSLPMFPELGRLSDRIGSALDNARNIAHGLSPLMSSNGDLAAALAQLARSSAVGDTRIEASTRIESELRLSLEARTHLYRIAQEAIQNALKHADAHRIEVRLTVRSTAVKLEIEDDGHGIDQDRAKGSGFGTNAMRYRSSAIGGLLTIRAGKTGGTVISCIAPQAPPGDASNGTQRLSVDRMLG